MPSNSNLIAVIRFVLENAESAPLDKRIQIYRGLADICGDESESKELCAIAAELEKVHHHSRQFLFDFVTNNPIP